MFHLPPLESLAGRRNVRITDITRVGEDIRIMARLDKRD
jgi:hypothetical protein